MSKKENSNNLEVMRHTLAHIMMQSLERLYNAVPGVGPAIENGFYHDFDAAKQITDDDLQTIESEMKKIIGENLIIKRKEMTVAEGLKLLKQKGYKYTAELAEDLKKAGEKKVSFYEQGEFVNMCKGPHVSSTGGINPNAFKLTKIAGAYWKGDEKNKMIQRIYGAAFATQKELDDYLAMLMEAEKRDHRKIGKELDLFTFSDMVGQGMPLYTPKGTVIRNEIIKFSNELQREIGYQEVHTPQLNKAELFKISGHYDKFKDDMMSAKSHYSNEDYFLKPMNCPQHTQIYGSKKRSYRDLPIRYADFANLFRDEKPGELSGLTRLRCFSQDDGHCFCREGQIAEEFQSVLKAIQKALTVYKLEYHVRLSLWDEKQKDKYLGNREVWNKSQKLLEKLLKDNKIKYEIADGEAAFYGPKMDVIATDALGRQWQISTIQLDFNMPVRFNLTYTDKDGTEKHPIMIHRAIVGSPERFMAILIEHYAGAFPLWLSPVQIKLVAVSEKHIKHCERLAAEFREHDIRVEIDAGDETVGNKIRKAIGEKAPYMLVIGDKEEKSSKLHVRDRGRQEVREIEQKAFILEIKQKIANRE